MANKREKHDAAEALKMSDAQLGAWVKKRAKGRQGQLSAKEQRECFICADRCRRRGGLLS